MVSCRIVNNMESKLKRYRLFGWDYEHFNPLMNKEIAWYTKFAQKTGGPILELACGTARLLISLAKAGYNIDGIDLSTDMLEQAGKRILRLSPEIRSRIKLHKMDMSDFRLDCQYALIILADNSFGQLKTKEQQLSCLKCTCHHLEPGGIFLMAVRRFEPKRFAHGPIDMSWSDPLRHPVDGVMVRRKLQGRLSEDGKWMLGALLYKETDAEGRETIEECPFEIPVMTTDDYLTLFAETGFSLEVFVDYVEKQDDGVGSILCFVCRKRE